MGVIVLEVDLASIFKLVQDSTGMGETGETLIARKEDDAALFLNPLRHDPDAALKRKVVFGQSQAIPIQEALKGNAGHGIFGRLSRQKGDCRLAIHAFAGLGNRCQNRCL